MDFLDHYLPDTVKSLVDLSTLALCSSSFIVSELRELNTDVLFSAELKLQACLPTHPNKKKPRAFQTKKKDRAFFYLHLEHQTDPDPLMAWRMIDYMVPIITYHLKTTGSKVLPIVIPLVLYS